MADFTDMTAAQLNDWYERTVGYRPQVDDPTLDDAELRKLCIEVDRFHNADPHAICAKWVKRIGGGFHPDTRANSYAPALSSDDEIEYEQDMEILFAVASDPYECAVMAMADAGLC